MADQKLKLRMMTTLAPDLPKEYFEILREIVQNKLQCDMEPILFNETWRGENVDTAENPFSSGQADFGFISPSAYIRATAKGDKSFEFLPVGALHVHPNAHNQPVYFSEAVIATKNKEKYDDLEKLRGATWAYSHDKSLSGSLYPRHRLRAHGDSSIFFSNRIQAGSSIAALELVRGDRAQAATVNSTVLYIYFKQHPEAANEIFASQSMGPLPIYPVVVRSELPGDVKENIKNALLAINDNEEAKKKLEPYGVIGFAPSSPDMYYLSKDIFASLQCEHKLDSPFY